MDALTGPFAPSPGISGPSRALPWPLDRLARAAWDEASFCVRRLSPFFPVGLTQRMAWAIDKAQRPCIWQYTGTTHDSARVLYVGNEVALRTAFFRALVSGAEPATRAVCRAPIEPGFSPAADVALVEVPSHAARRFAESGWIVLPRWIDLEVDLGPPEGVLWKARKRETIRAIERTHLELEVATGREAAREFFEQMYVPTARARHGGHAYVRRFRYVERAARRGVFVFARLSGRRLAGLLLVPRLGAPRRIDAWLFGVSDGDYRRAPLAREAAYLFALRWARDTAGAERLGLTTAPPLLRDGLLRFKARWGAVASPNLRGPRAIALRFARGTPALAAALCEEPLVAVGWDESGPYLYAPLPTYAGQAKAPSVPAGIRSHRFAYADPAALPSLLTRIAVDSAGIGK